jgi:hypothetical protein
MPMTVSVDAAVMVEKLSPEEQKHRELLTKVHPTVAAVIERLQKKSGQPSADEAKFIRNGKAELQIWLTQKTPEVMESLKKLGFETLLEPKSAKLVIGRISIENLEKLAALKTVRFIAPQTSG